jgi:hypothetical protein
MELIFEWDESKSRANLKKHKVGFDEARTIFNDPFLVTYPDEFYSDDEERYVSVGISANNRVLLVSHAEREETDEVFIIRIISCRRATTSERKFYEERES